MSEDGMIPAINPLSKAELEPIGPVKIVSGPKDLSDEDIQDYARRIGVDTVKVKAISNRSIMGELVQRLGAVRVGGSMLIESEQMIQDGIKLCDEMLSTYAHDSKLVGSIMKVRLGFVDLWVKAAQSHITSAKNLPVEDSEKKPQQVPFPPPVPVQINIQANSVSKENPIH